MSLAACGTQRPASAPTPQLIHQDGRIAVMLTDIDPRRIRSYDSALVSFGTRHTYSDTVSSTQGVGAARRWIHAQLSAFGRACNGCLRVEYDTGMVQTTSYPGRPIRLVTNVVAWLPGRDTTRAVVIGGHYDSCVCAVGGAAARFDSTSTAPGANDDGSGTSAVIELARVFSRMFGNQLESTVIFALYDAEEQGLLGSTHLARRLKASRMNVIAAMTDDIVGNVTADDGTVDSTSVRIFAAEPDTSRSRELGRYVWAVGESYLPGFRVVPVWRLDRVNRGGDHRPYVQEGWAGLRFSERIENEKRQHRPTDELAWVNFGYVANVARLNAATVASLALAPATPDSARAARDVPLSGGRHWTLSWSAVPGAASYEVLLRATTSPQYERVVSVGAATSYDLHVQLDDHWAAIRAVGSNGQRSLPIVVPRVTRVIPAPDQ